MNHQAPIHVSPLFWYIWLAQTTLNALHRVSSGGHAVLIKFIQVELKVLKSLRAKLLFSLICIFALTPATYAVDGCSAAGFKVAYTINLESTPFGMDVADFDADGHLDLVVAPNSNVGEIMVLLGRGGTQRFGPPNNFPAGGIARSVSAGDFNGDGKPDLAISLDNFSGPSRKLSILLNDGTGKFGAPSIIDLAGDPRVPVISDLNNDGKLDIVTGLSTGSNDGSVAILLGNGAGGFTQAANSPLSTGSNNPGAVSVGDFNEDGKRDLALPGTFGVLSILLGDGTGGFAAGTNTTTNGSTLSFLVADFNEDTHLDVLMGNRMVLGTGTGSFGAPTTVAIPADSGADFAVDVNNDNHLDVVAASLSGLTIVLGDGTGALFPGKSYASGFTGFGASPTAVPGDFNEDGKIDLVAAQRRGVGILDGDGTGAFNDALSYSVSVANPSYLVAADFNNDGKQDFATLSPNTAFPNGSKLEVALGDGNGGFTQKSVSNFSIFPPGAIATADFNGDGKLDIAVTQPTAGRVSILLNDGTGGFPVSGASAPNISVGFQPSAIEAGDFNNDTKADLVVLAPVSNSLVVLLGDGSGGFASVFGGSLLGVSGLTDIAIGDFNADGKSDLAVVRSDIGLVNVLHGDGAGHFSSIVTPSIPGLPSAVAVRDFNGDNKPDIAVSSSAFEVSFRQFYITVLINNGASGFNPGTSYPTNEAGALGVGDFNSDNHPDLAASTNGNGDGIVVLTNKGNGEFSAPIYFSTGLNSDHLAINDFNNDGKDDALISNPSGNNVALLLNNFISSLPCLSINDVTVTESDSGTVDATFTVTMSRPSEETVRVNYFLTPGSLSFDQPLSTKGADFESVSGTVIFVPSGTTQTITVRVIGDVIDEFDQIFNVVLTTPINAAISDGKGLGKITDNDAPATISVNDTTVAEGTSTQNSAAFTVTLNGQSEKPISVQLTRAAGTASPGIDFENFGPDTLQFPAGTTSKTYLVPIIQDNVFEPDETFFVNLINPTNATIADGQGQGTITNDDSQPTITIAGSFRTEGALGTSVNATFDVRLLNPSHQTITVAFATADGTATAGNDYVATTGTVTFNPGETIKSVPVEVLGDNVDEVNETYFVNLTNPTNATIATAQGAGTIQDDDGPTVSIGDASVTEGNIGSKNLAFTVTLSGPSVQDVFVTYGTVAGTATPGFDFSPVFSGTVFIPAGSTSATLNIRILGDLNIEPDEQFTVNLQFASNAIIADGQATGTIVNDDSKGKLQFSSATFSAPEDFGGVVVTVNRVDGATDAVTVDFATSSGTATAPADYPETTGTLTLNHGETSKSFFISFVKDNLAEPDETLTVTLSNPTGGAILGTPTSATLTIKPPQQLLLALEDAALDPNQVAAFDALLMLRDPFPVINTLNLLFGQQADRNTRVVVFVTNLQLAPGETASTVRVNLLASNGQTFDIGAEDVRLTPVSNLSQVTFRLPDNLASGVCAIKIKANDQESNQGNIRIQ